MLPLPEHIRKLSRILAALDSQSASVLQPDLTGAYSLLAVAGACRCDCGHGTSAALEFAVKILRVRRIILLGHADCDGVHAMVHGPLRNAQDFLAPWMDIAEPVMWPMPEQGDGEVSEAAIEDAVLQLSLTNLRTFPWIRDAERSGYLSLSL